MSIITAKAISIAITVLMFCFSLNPLAFAGFYIFFRPSVQPFAYLKYPLWGTVPLTSLFALSLIIYTVVDCMRNGFGFLKGNVVYLYVLCIFSSVSFVNTPDMSLSLGHLLKLLTAISMYLLVYNNVHMIADVKRVFTCYFLSALVPLAFGFYQYMTKTAHAWENGPGGTRIDSVLGECNAYGEYLATLICVLIAASFLKKFQYPKWMLAVLSSAILLSFLLSQNRGSWISLVVGIAIATIWYRRHVHVTFVASLLILITLASSPIVVSRFLELHKKSEFGSHNTLQGRLDYHKKLFELVKKHPIVGYGLGTAGYSSVITYPPHNDYLRIALESGLPGTLFYIFFLFKELFSHIQRVRTNTFGVIHYASFVLIIYFIILSFFQNIIYNVTVFPMILGLFAISEKLHFLEQSQEMALSE